MVVDDRSVVEKMFGSANIQSVGLNHLSVNRFASSDMVGKEMNLVTEVDDSHFNAELINNLKAGNILFDIVEDTLTLHLYSIKE